MNRLQELSTRCFPGKADALIITAPVNRQYLLGFHSSAGTLVLLPEKRYFIIDFRYFEKAQQQVTGCELILQDKLYDQINEILSAHQVKTVGLEDDSVTLSELSVYRKRLQAEVVAGSGMSQQIAEMRLVKSAQEIEQVALAQKMSEQAFLEMLKVIRPGMTEKEVALELEYRMKKQGADGISFDTIAVAGKNSSLPHGEPGDYRLENGDFLTMDFGALVHGYHADMTRTIGIGEVSEKQKKVYHTVLEAQRLAFEQIRPGQVCSEIDSAAREYIDSCGYQGCFGHGLGHGVGLEIHEEPRFSPLCDVVLREGMILSVEPGIYLPGEFGVRIEDLVVIEKDGFRNLNTSPKELICLS